MAHVSLPDEFLDCDVTLEFLDYGSSMDYTGRIIESNYDHHVLLQTKDRLHLIPWSAIASIWIPKKKEDLLKVKEGEGST